MEIVATLILMPIWLLVLLHHRGRWFRSVTRAFTVVTSYALKRRPVDARDLMGAALTTSLVTCIGIGANHVGNLRWLVFSILPLVAVCAGACFGSRALTIALSGALLLFQLPALNVDQVDGLQLFLVVIAACSLILVRIEVAHGARTDALSLSLGRTRATLLRTKSRLRVQTERHKVTIRVISDAIFYWDVRGDVLRWRANGRQRFGGASPSSKVWPLLDRCLDERDRHRVLQDLQGFMDRNEAVWRSEFTLKGRGGSAVAVSVRGILERDASGKPWRMTGAVTDMTDAKVAKESARALARAARLATVGEITASITHEVNQPLAAILNNAETGLLLLQRKQESADVFRAIVDDIRSDARRASEIVRRTRALLQDREMVREWVNVNKLVMESVDLLWLQAQRRGIALLNTSDSSIPLVHADEVHLQQVVLNLISNALDATEMNVGRAKRVEVSTTHYSGKVVVRVEDTGCGIAPAQLDTIFESFNTSKANGLGLGLSIARSIVKAHGGRIVAVNNRPGPGASVSFELPIAADVTTKLQAPEPQHDMC
jgi:signal transduction histidine kinase